ncbi:hypothetical protein, partial [Longimicrobium sp.]|uniref:hypothetical protein n=1 Tax=Longimicrobium sp. TaxID=2029185 RepID=UPI002E303442
LLVTASASVPLAAQPWPAPSAEFRASSSGGISAERVRSTTLARVTLAGDVNGLLAIDQEQWSDAEDEDQGGTIRVRALGWDGAAFTRPMWTVESAADRWSLEPFGYLRLTRYGCCDMDVTHTLYDLATGQEVAWYTDGPPLTLYGQAGGPVLVAFESPRSTRVPEGLDASEVQGRLRLIRGTAVADEVVIAGSGETETGYVSPDGLFCDARGRIQARAPDGVSDETGFAVCYQFEGGAWAVIPVRGGRFDVHAATLPQGIALVRGGW